MFFIAKYLPKTPFFQRLALQAPGGASALSAVGVPKPDHPLVGEHGVADSHLRPSGRARIAGEEHDVVSEAGYVEKGGAVRVVAVRGSTVVVRPEQDSA
jgi:membrane-bound serine protease (ClpP class)